MLSTIYETIIVNPLRKLYFYGPAMMQLGFWGGKQPSELCQEITTYSEQFWRDNLEQCQDIIEAKFMSFRITVEIAVYFSLLYHFAKYSSTLCLLLFYKCTTCRETTQSPSYRPVIYIPESPAPHIQMLYDARQLKQST